MKFSGPFPGRLKGAQNFHSTTPCVCRPALIVSPAEFNEATQLPVILPITTGGEFAPRLVVFHDDGFIP